MTITTQHKMLVYLDSDVVRMFLNNANVPSFLQIVCASVIVLFFDKSNWSLFSVIWLLCFSFLVLWKLWRISNYVERNTSGEKIRADKPFWLKKFGTNILLGVVWAWGAVHYYKQASLMDQLFLVVITMLLISIGGFSRLVCPRLFLGFTLPISVPLIYLLLETGSAYHVILALILIGLILFKLWEWQYLHAMSEELSRQRGIAQQANQAKSTFLAAASHDLRQPVHALGLFLEDIRNRFGKTDNTVTYMQNSLDTIQGLLESLLDISKLDAGVVSPDIVNFRLADVLLRVQKSFDKVAAAKGLKFSVDSSDFNVISDPNLLYSILSNLVGNAIKYTQSGEVILRCGQVDDKVLIEVIDTGSGIPDSEKSNIFKEFYQLTQGNLNRSGGLGLGLAIVERLSKLLNFKIELDSSVNQGSRFYFELPLAKVPNIVPVRALPNFESEFSGKHVLVIDNDDAILESLSKLLKNWGCIVSVSKEYTEALERIKTDGSPDIMIVDFDLDGSYNGLETVTLLQRQLSNTCKCLIISGSATKEALQAIHRFGLTALNKPVAPARLRMALSEA